MSKIVIDVTRLLGRFLKGRLPTGIDRVSLAYIDYFSQRALAMIQLGQRRIVLSESASRLLFTELRAPSTKFKWHVLRLVGSAYFKFQNQSSLHGALLFNTGHSGLERVDYRKWIDQYQLRPLFVVHDLIPITHPEYCRTGEQDKHVRRMNNVLSLACGVITNSQDTLDQLARYADCTQQAMPPAVSALLAAAPLPAVVSTRPITTPYFVILSTIEPRKNHWMLLQIWRKLVKKMGVHTPKLLVIGQRGWECENVVDLLERCDVLRDVVCELPICSDDELAIYLQHAQALLFPSFAEGYGMPLVEALSLGLPVIASDLPVFHEIAGAIPDYLDPLDGMGWMALIEAYTNPDSTERAAQLKRLEQFNLPTWDHHFQLVEGLLERLQ